ncbi:UNVERIFIED_CONTAM: hypothetical protein Sangu_0011600 [Sesamum angustifolium]|uniref:Uncharacterized protein n=1 Tax=Sesamum angustifolium TaxID=2727405 RepID=A0AAW2RJ36_9LAMI
MEEDRDDYESDGKVIHNYYSEDMYPGEDGQLSWFNAGVRVGVGIGLGMCLGVGLVLVCLCDHIKLQLGVSGGGFSSFTFTLKITC